MCLKEQDMARAEGLLGGEIEYDPAEDRSQSTRTPSSGFRIVDNFKYCRRV